MEYIFFFTTGASVATSDTDLQKRVSGTKRSAESPQDARSVVEAVLKYLKSGQGDVQRGLTQVEAEKQGSASSQISCGNKGILLLTVLKYDLKSTETKC